MGLDSIWTEEGDYLTKKSQKFKARSTGCSCCSCELHTEKEVRKEAIDSLSMITRASRYFGWDLDELIKEAKKKMRKDERKKD